DGWTPERQVAFLEALADTGIVRKAAAMVGMSEQSVSRLRRRSEARDIDVACDAAQRMGGRGIESVAWQRAMEGTIRQHYYHGELKGEERVFDNKLLIYLLGRVNPLLEPRPEAATVETDWDRWMEAVRQGAPPPIPIAQQAPETDPTDEFDGSEVWQDMNGDWWTEFPPPPDFDGYEETDPATGYRRSLSDRELAVAHEEEAKEAEKEAARRDRFFGFRADDFSDPMQAEPSTPSRPFDRSKPGAAPSPEMVRAETQRRREAEVPTGAGSARNPGLHPGSMNTGRREPDTNRTHGCRVEPGMTAEPLQPLCASASLREQKQPTPPPQRPLERLKQAEQRIAAAPAVDVHVKQSLSTPDASAPETQMSPITTHRHGDVLVVTSNNPPVNALGHAVRDGLVNAIAEAEGDAAVKAVVIVCQGQTFFAGADISEFGTPKSFESPALPQVVDIIENCSKPVVAAIHGTAFGGGLEVALASHYRVAVPSAKLGVPEVKLGLLPGAGGTQRLPRVAGVQKALEMCATGNPI